jgi:Lon protease-like protein
MAEDIFSKRDLIEERRSPSQIPIFPLPNVVLFPNMMLPLHIFEARYRKMVNDCLNGDHYLGMILLREGWERGEIAYFEVGGMGVITHVLRHPGGNMDIVLRGLSRYRVKAFVQQKPYLIGEVEILEEEWEDSPALEMATSHMMELFRRSLERQPKEVREKILSQVNLLQSPVDLANSLASVLNTDVYKKQALLEAPTVRDRVRLLTSFLKGELARFN